VAPVASFAALLLAAAALYGLRGVSPRQRVMGFPYARRAAFLSEGEARLWRALREEAPGIEVFPRARLEDVVAVRSGLPKVDHALAEDRIRSRFLDFVLVDPVSMRVLAVVEVGAASADTARARDGNRLVDAALAAAGVPLVRVPAAASTDVVELRRELAEALGALLGEMA